MALSPNFNSQQPFVVPVHPHPTNLEGNLSAAVETARMNNGGDGGVQELEQALRGLMIPRSQNEVSSSVHLPISLPSTAVNAPISVVGPGIGTLNNPPLQTFNGFPIVPPPGSGGVTYVTPAPVSVPRSWQPAGQAPTFQPVFIPMAPAQFARFAAPLPYAAMIRPNFINVHPGMPPLANTQNPFLVPSFYPTLPVMLPVSGSDQDASILGQLDNGQWVSIPAQTCDCPVCHVAVSVMSNFEPVEPGAPGPGTPGQPNLTGWSPPLIPQAGDGLLPNPASLLPNPSSLLPNPPSLLPNPTSLLPNPPSLLPNPTSLLPNPPALLPNPPGFTHSPLVFPGSMNFHKRSYRVTPHFHRRFRRRQLHDNRHRRREPYLNLDMNPSRVFPPHFQQRRRFPRVDLEYEFRKLDMETALAKQPEIDNPELVSSPSDSNVGEGVSDSLELVEAPAANQPPGRKHCQLCRSNGETPEFFQGHVIKDEQGIIQCPVLRALVCDICGATGDTAHTVKYCPCLAGPDESEEKPDARLPTNRNAAGGYSVLKY